MTAGLIWVLVTVLAYFTAFILALGYGQWTTRGLEPAGSKIAPVK